MNIITILCRSALLSLAGPAICPTRMGRRTGSRAVLEHYRKGVDLGAGSAAANPANLGRGPRQPAAAAEVYVEHGRAYPTDPRALRLRAAANRCVGLAIGGVMALFPTLALANMGVGYVMVPLPLIIVSLVPVIALEALVLRPMLHAPLRRATWLSLTANLHSTLYGLALGILIDVGLVWLTGSAGPEPTKAFASAMLVPFMLFSWWIEYRVIAGRAESLAGRRVAVATGAANLLSYAGLLVLIGATAWFPDQPTIPLRIKISEALTATAPVRDRIEEFWAEHHRLPEDADNLGAAIPVSTHYRIIVNTGGEVSVLLTLPTEPPLDQKRLILTPVASGDDQLGWRCSAPDIAPRLLPPHCRPQPP